MDEMQALTQRGPQDDVFLRNVLCLAAAVWLTWEYIITCRDEYQYIWRGSMNRVKVLYIFARYFTLGVQWANTYIVFAPLSRVPVPRHGCVGWFLFLMISASLLLAAIDSLIMLRVYALYNCSSKMTIFLTSLLAMQGMLIAIIASRNLHLLPFSETCNVLETPHEVAYIMAGVMVAQTILLLLTLARRKIAFGESLVVRHVVRDGAWVFVLVISMCVAILPSSLFTHASKPHIIFVWPIALMSITTCRLIINMQKIPLETLSNRYSNSGSTGTGIAFTSYIEMTETSRISIVSTHPNHSRGSTL
ncbi:hypothetical protein BDZ97DRAFT_2077295 [Flammula alnicola]|nr:hypothetical protein BDZ97DRAFT_2077295 [Flammula alnicola]